MIHITRKRQFFLKRFKDYDKQMFVLQKKVQTFLEKYCWYSRNTIYEKRKTINLRNCSNSKLIYYLHWQPWTSTRMLGCRCHETVWNWIYRAMIGRSRYTCFTEYASVLPSNTCNGNNIYMQFRILINKINSLAFHLLKKSKSKQFFSSKIII